MAPTCLKKNGEYRVLGCWGLMEGDVGFGDLEKEVELVVCELC